MRINKHALRLLLAMLLAAAPAVAAAVDLDVAIGEQERQAAVAPSCAALRKKIAPAPPRDQYRKGICLLYGLHGKADPEAGMALLRGAASADYAEAQMALGDRLQSGPAGDQTEALHWYQLAQAAGDTRAQGRHQHLSRRLEVEAQAASPGALPEPPEGTIVNPTPEEMQTLYGAGYHCHRMGMGERWCHDSADGI